MIIDETGEHKTHQYWSLSSSDEKTNRQDLVVELTDRLESSVKQHLQSDVPVGSFLSGGYDSSALVYLMSKLGYQSSTFSVGFDGWDKSEHQYAEVVAERFGMKHHSKILDQGGLALLDRLSYVYDEPIADISIIPLLLLEGGLALFARKPHKPRSMACFICLSLSVRRCHVLLL